MMTNTRRLLELALKGLDAERTKLTTRLLKSESSSITGMVLETPLRLRVKFPTTRQGRGKGER
jgi:hypothetical protein